MKKTALRTLQARYNPKGKARSQSYAQLLKRKRLESNRTLEEVSQGICSSSYLSKIENALVDVEEQYYQLLFDKLNIPYANIEKEREKRIFHVLIRKYLLKQNDEIEDLIKQAVDNNTYSEIEIELLVFFLNVIRGRFEESKILIIKLEQIRNALTNKELLFFVFATALYFYLTNQTEKAYLHALILCEINYEDEVLKTAVYDLACDIFYLMGAFPLFSQYYILLSRLSTHLLVKRISRHRMQSAVRLSKYDYDQSMVKMDNEYLSIDMHDEAGLEDYYFYQGCIYYLNGKYDLVISMPQLKCFSSRIIALIICSIDRINDLKLALNYLDKFKDHEFSLYELVYQNHFEYVRQKFEQYGYVRLMNYIKQNIIQVHRQYHHDFFFKIAMRDLLSLGMGMGKYKETLKLINSFH